MSDWNAATAEWYAEHYGEAATNRLAVDALKLAPDAVVVDVGCGTGAALRHAAARVTAWRLIGVDPVPRMIEIARQRTADHPAADRISYRVGAAEDLPLNDDCADWVLAFDSIDHWKDRQAGLAEVRRVLRPEGRLAVVKDGDVPGARAACDALTEDLQRAGLVIHEREETSGEGVQFTLWVCAVRHAAHFSRP